ncbi:MAG: MAPEG family protein [Limimaricola sp.]|uniref:MAPEG family protein n=1 Tax=Limimaricola sp. TaxID=2211665 RepID=UPI001E075484|nr:MAPEG family protein [Limimaricola sp.]MBI1416354.1 MAPEG family protein [Limimaricola sp.]
MRRRGLIGLGMAAGVLWGLGLVWVGVSYVPIPIFLLAPTLAFSFLGPGIVLTLMIGRLAARRFFDDAAIDGAPFEPGSSGEIDQRVLQNTLEQLALALALWPPTAYLMLGSGPGVVSCLGIGFVIARVAFWAGYHRWPPLRAFGFAATFYPTIIALVWALVIRLT